MTKKPRKPKEPVKASVSFHCPTCDCTMETVDAFKKHLAETHGITEFKGTRKMTMHLDCSDSYHSIFELEIGGLKFLQSTCNPRNHGDYLSGPQ